MTNQPIALWLLAFLGAIIVWSSITAANAMTRETRTFADTMGWSATGMVGLWSMLLPLADDPGPPIDTPHIIMAASLAALSWRMAHGPRKPRSRQPA